MFNPFDRPPGSDLDENDLLSLVTNKVAEGFFVEYKESFPSSKKIANGIAALANTNGGWFIVGVRTNPDNEAADVCGYDPADCMDAASLIRNSCRDHLDPFPPFDLKIVPLRSRRKVAVVRVPPSDDAPHISRDGKVYIRKGDAKEPSNVQTKHQLEIVEDRAKRSKENFELFCQPDSRLIGKGLHFIQISIAPRPQSDFHPPPALTSCDISALKKVMDAAAQDFTIQPLVSNENSADLHFTCFYRLGNRVIFEREATGESKIGLALELDSLGRTKILIPIETFGVSEALKSPLCHDEARRFLAREVERIPDCFDVSVVMEKALHLVATYITLLGDVSSIGGYRLKLEASHPLTVTPISFSPEWIAYSARLGIPKINRSSARIPFHPLRSVECESENDLVDRVAYSVHSLLGLPADVAAKALLWQRRKTAD